MQAMFLLLSVDEMINIVAWACKSPQKKRTSKKGKAEAKQAVFVPLSADEKNDIASHELELLHADIEQVCLAALERLQRLNDAHK